MKSLENKTIQGIINIHKATLYPLRLEIIFLNDKNGKEFFNKISEVFGNLPEEKNYEVNFKDENSDLTNSVDILFNNEISFQNYINKLFEDFSFYDEREKTVLTKEDIIMSSNKYI